MKRRDLKWIILLVVILVIVIVGFALVKKNTKPVENLGNSQEQINATNASRDQDVQKIAAAISSYINANNDSLPQTALADSTPGTIDICGGNCSSKETVALNYYQTNPPSVSFQNYSQGLAVTNSKKVYVVDNAPCDSSRTGLGQQTQTNHVAILYMHQTGSSNTQVCLQL